MKDHSFTGHLILIRHGESELNAANKTAEKRFCGQFDSPLTELGRAQATHVGKVIADWGVSIDWAVASGLSRAIETLRLLSNELQGVPESLPHQDGFNERSLGIFEGQSEADIFEDYPEYFDHPDFKFFRKHFVQRAPGGENLTDVTERVWKTWEMIRPRVSGNGIVVSHGVALQAFLGRALGLTDLETLAIKIPNASPIILRYQTDNTASPRVIFYLRIDPEQLRSPGT